MSRPRSSADSVPVHSVAKTLTKLMSISANRSCADCRSTLVDASQAYASVSPTLQLPSSQLGNFRLNHRSFAPPGQQIPRAEDLPVDPALLAAERIGGHGVFVCALCGAAHKLLGTHIAVVHAVQDVSAWSLEEVQRLARAGNTRTTIVLEAFLSPHWEFKRPKPETSVADRLKFIRAKYEALAFTLPQPGPLAPAAWKRIVAMHAEWQGLWGANLYDMPEWGLEQHQQQHSFKQLQNFKYKVEPKKTEVPDRLVDYFCVVKPSDYVDPLLLRSGLAKMQSPEDLLLVPAVSDCYPLPNSHEGDLEFPAHVSTFLFPDGCRPSCTPLPPTFFTFVLTTSGGDRIYGGVLRVYEDDRDLDYLRQALENSDYTGKLPEWLEPGAGGLTKSQRSESWASDMIFLPKCLVVLSHHPLFDLWRKFLTSIYRICLVEAPLPIERFIANFCCEIPLPPPGQIQVKCGFTVKDIWCIQRPPENHLPMADFSFKPLFAALSLPNVLIVFACLLQESRVALLSRHKAVLCPVAEALTTLLFPFRWEGMYIPVLPYSLLDILDAPVPFLVGLDSKYLSETPPKKRPHGVVFVDLDRDEVHLGFEDESDEPRSVPCLPERYAFKLKARIEEFASSSYVMPPSSKVATVTYGMGEKVPLARRASYLQPSSSDTKSASLRRRREVFGNADKAYNENELQVPITGFLSEHGQFFERDAPTPTSASKDRLKFSAILRRSPQRAASFESIDQFHDMGNLLEMDEPSISAAQEIREAFVSFFVSLLKGYRQCMDRRSFRSDEFVSNLNISAASSDFLDKLLKTQMFERFIDDRRENPDDPEVRFFDESINAKMKRSKKNAIMKMRRGGSSHMATSFLDDTSSVIKETFAPPPPSNWGLPDDGRTYTYGSFPPLNPELFGKIRQPRRWTRTRHASLRRRMSVAAQQSEQAVFAKALIVRPTATLVSVTKRGAKNLEHAINALSNPFVGALAPKKSASLRRSGNKSADGLVFRSSVVSDVTMPSELGLEPDILTSAEEIVLNARRKQSILLGIICRLQVQSRVHVAPSLHRGGSRGVEKRLSVPVPLNGRPRRQSAQEMRALVLLQAFIRMRVARTRFRRVRVGVSKLKACSKGRLARYALTSIRETVIRVQARCRGFIVRQLLSSLVHDRLEVYRHHIFELWGHQHTSLCYRVKFWQILQPAGLIQVGLAETEIQRLWKALKITPPRFAEDARKLKDGELLAGIRLRCSNRIHWQVIRLDERNLSVGMEPTALNKREAAERLQVYERLSTSSHDDHVFEYFARFSLPLKHRLKKAVLAESIWMQYSQASDSVALMLELFPELADSTNLIYREPSKKGIRRLKSSSTLPGALEPSERAHTMLQDRIHRNVRLVAEIGLLRVPSLSIHLSKLDEPRVQDLWKIQIESNIMLVRGIDDRVTCRRTLMREWLYSTERSKSPRELTDHLSDKDNCPSSSSFWSKESPVMDIDNGAI